MTNKKAIHEYYGDYNKAYDIIEKAFEADTLPKKLESKDCYKRLAYSFLATTSRDWKHTAETCSNRINKLESMNCPEVILDCEKRMKEEAEVQEEAYTFSAAAVSAISDCESAEISPKDTQDALNDYITHGCENCVYRDSKPGDFGTACFCKLEVEDEVKTETYVIEKEDGTTEEISAEEAHKQGLDKRSVYESGRHGTMFAEPCDQFRRMRFPEKVAEEVHKKDEAGSGKWIKFIEEHYCSKCPDKTFCGTEPGGDWDPRAKWNCITDKIQIELVKSDEAHNDTPEKRLLRAIFGEEADDKA